MYFKMGPAGFADEGEYGMRRWDPGWLPKFLPLGPVDLEFSSTKMGRLGQEQGGGEGDAGLVFWAMLR